MSRTKIEQTKPHVVVSVEDAMAAGWAAPQNFRFHRLTIAIQRALLMQQAKDATSQSAQP